MKCKFHFGEKKSNSFDRDIFMDEIKLMRQTRNSPYEQTKQSSKVFHLFLNNIQLKQNSFIDNSVEALLQTFYDKLLVVFF